MRAAARLALGDLYYHSIRLVPANLAWGVVFLAVAWTAVSIGPAVALLLAPLLAFPLFAIARSAGLIVRGRDVVLADAWTAIRDRPARTLVAGTGVTVVIVVLAVNVLIGATSGTPIALALAVLAGWGLVAMWLTALPFFVILADPLRPDIALADAARLAAGLLLVRPGRVLALHLVLVLVLAVSTVLMAALLTVGVAYAALLTARIVLPAADGIAGVPERASADG